MALAAIRLPAALLLGPMLAAILIASIGWGVRIPPGPNLIAQAVIGCLIARSIPPTIAGEILHHWPLFFAVVAVVIAASTTDFGLRLLSVAGAFRQYHPARGDRPARGYRQRDADGAAYGADIRLVAFMQHARVLLVAQVATVVARLWTAGRRPSRGALWFPPIAWIPFTETLALVAFGAAAARLRGVSRPHPCCCRSAWASRYRMPDGR